MKPVYLHIGTHNTGTTSIQKFLAQADGILAEQGILYPETGRPDTTWSDQYGQHELYWSIVGKRGIGDETVWDEFHQEKNEHSGQSVVISTEGFWACTAEQIRRIISHLAPHPIHIVVYLRPPMQFLQSSYTQRVELSTYMGSFRQYVGEVAHHCNYLEMISRWEQFDAVASVDIRLFDKVKTDPGLEASFADAVGIDFEEVRSFAGHRANASPPDDLVQIARWINVLAALGDGSETWQALADRARSNLLDSRWPGTWLASIAQPFVRESLITDRSIDALRGNLGDTHERFLRKYVCSKDRAYLPLGSC